ncbi:hypothetical protein WR25_27156 [Diploscapter pachys]|uniref:Uncharacterized protein n=1 Tax=Diploscapter pachys TaxID=2018661 RepID=A0A2A2LW94_9BILA|nr:hypothetical protein WR25_27156 [Diploscapter pachys]
MSSDNMFEPVMENESIITANVSDVHAGFIYTATAIYGSVVIFGCITVVLFIAVLLKGNTTFKEYPFFKIVWALTIVNAIHMTMQLTCIFPSLFINIEEDSLMEIWYGISSRIIFATDYGAVIFLLLMALNRFAVFVVPFMQPIFSKSISSTFNQMLNPILFFSSNSTVRKTFRKLMKCQKSDHVIILSNSDIPSARHSFSLGTKVRIRVTKFGRKYKANPENGAATSSATSQSPIAMTKDKSSYNVKAFEYSSYGFTVTKAGLNALIDHRCEMVFSMVLPSESSEILVDRILLVGHKHHRHRVDYFVEA